MVTLTVMVIFSKLRVIQLCISVASHAMSGEPAVVTSSTCVTLSVTTAGASEERNTQKVPDVKITQTTKFIFFRPQLLDSMVLNPVSSPFGRVGGWSNKKIRRNT